MKTLLVACALLLGHQAAARSQDVAEDLKTVQARTLQLKVRQSWVEQSNHTQGLGAIREAKFSFTIRNAKPALV